MKPKRSRKRRNPISATTHQIRPGVLSKPKEPLEQIQGMLVSIAKLYGMIATIIGCIGVSTFFLTPTLSALRSWPPYVMIAWILTCSVLGVRGYKSVDDVSKLREAVPIERLDFSYVAARYNAALFYITLECALILLPTLQGMGFIQHVADEVAQYVTTYVKLADALAWVVAMGVGGTIGNVMTFCLSRVIGAVLRRRHVKRG